MKKNIYYFIIGISLISFVALVVVRNITGTNEWLDKEIYGEINDIAVKKNDKYTFFKIDENWYSITSRNSAFEENSYIGYYFKKNKGEEVFWLKKSFNSNDSISFWTHGAYIITSKTEINSIEKNRLTWN
jgi:ABC-type transport system involved in multi-copper enzyme maturation permease subunit